MKIGVVTIYNSQNCGSYLQAYALTNYLKSLGHDAALVRNNMYYKNKFFYRVALTIKYILKFELKKSKNIFNTYWYFNKARKKYSYFAKNEALDLCIFGSDTIWNISDDYFKSEWKHYFGYDMGVPKITYAASIGPTDAGDILKRDDMCGCLKSFMAISVRDDKTFKLMKTVTGSEPRFVVDPTMLMDKKFYESLTQESSDDKYILFYCFERIEHRMFKEIKKYASDNNLKLICFGENITGCDKQLIFNPSLMMTYYKNASFVVTDTFHGNVFSLIFNKQFLNIERGKEKVTSLLEKFSLCERTAKEPSDVDNILSQKIDFEGVNKNLADFSKSSKEFLMEEISKIERRKNNAC